MSGMERNMEVMNWSGSWQAQQKPTAISSFFQEHLYGSSIQGSQLKNVTSSSSGVRNLASGQVSWIHGSPSQISHPKGMTSLDVMKYQSGDHVSWIHSSRQDSPQGGSKKRETEHPNVFDRDIFMGHIGKNAYGNLPSGGVRNPESSTDIETEFSDKTHIRESDNQRKAPSIVNKEPNIPKRQSNTSSSAVSKTVQLLTDFCSNSSKPKLITCEICTKYFNTVSEIEEHLSEHIDVWTVQCSLCECRFTHQKYLDLHMENHSQFQSFVCDLCDKSYPSAKTFKRHRRTKHEIRTPFLQPCPECDMKYVIGKYEAHCRKQHRGYSKDDEQGYKCDLCSLNFKLKSRLEMHRKVHGMEKTFLCADCGKTFKSQDNLRVHSKIHGPNYKKETVQCTKCEKMVDKVSLNQHMIFHSSKRSFKCEECGYSFLMKHHLTTHMKSHSDERPYVCGICQASFKLPHRLRAHRKTHGDDVEA